MKIFVAALFLALLCLAAVQGQNRQGNQPSGGGNRRDNSPERGGNRGNSNERQGGGDRRGNSNERNNGGNRRDNSDERRGGQGGRRDNSRSNERFPNRPGFPRPPFPIGPAPIRCQQCFAIRNGCTGAGCSSPFVRYIAEHEGNCMMAVITCPGARSTQLLTEFGNTLATGFSIDEVASCVNGQWTSTDSSGFRRTFTALRCMSPQIFG